MNNTITRQQALERLISLESEAAQLRKVLDEKPYPASLLPYPDKTDNQQAYYIKDGENGQFEVGEMSSKKTTEDHANVFSSREDAEAYKDAINTFLMLRKCEGSTTTKERVAQWLIEYDVEAEKVITTRRYVLSSKISRLSPAFDTEANAQKAIKTIGKDKLTALFKTTHHVE